MNDKKVLGKTLVDLIKENTVDNIRGFKINYPKPPFMINDIKNSKKNHKTTI